MKKIISLLLALLLLASCASKKEEAVKNSLSAFYGTWKASKLKYEDTILTVEELELLGDDSFSNVYIVIKEGGTAFLVEKNYESVFDVAYEYNKTNNTVSMGIRLLELDETNTMSFTTDDTTVYLDYYSSSQNFADLLQSEEIIDDNKEETGNQPEEKDKEPEKKSGLSDDFLDVMDAYEDFIDEYCTFMKKFSDGETTAEMLLDYAKFMSDYASWTDKFEKWESEDMSDEETRYYIDVQLRCNEKLTKVALSMN